MKRNKSKESSAAQQRRERRWGNFASRQEKNGIRYIINSEMSFMTRKPVIKTAKCHLKNWNFFLFLKNL